MKDRPTFLFLATFLTSMALLLYEVALTRVFSVILNYHFVFVVVSFALLGMGIGSFIQGRWFRDSGGQLMLRIALFGAGALSLSIGGLLLVVLPLSASVNFGQPGFYLYLLIAAVPFLFGGMNLSWIFQRWSKRASVLYAADLTGAALGVGIAWVLLQNTSGIAAIMGSGVLAGIGVVMLMFVGEARRIRSVIPLVLSVAMFLAGLWQVYPEVPVGADKDKDLYRMLNGESYPEIVESRWSAFGRTDLVADPAQPHEMLLFVDGAAGTPMIHLGDTMTDSLKMHVMQRWALQYFPYSFLTPDQMDSAYVIGPGGGKDIVIAKSMGVNHVTAVEVNPDIVELVREYEEYNGGVYTDWENVEVRIGEGRQVLRSSDNRYDIISLALPVTKSRRSYEGYALTEDYLFTAEALQEYLTHLTPKGRIMILAHGEPEVVRLVSTVLKAFEQRGISNQKAMEHLYAISDGMLAQLVIQKQPFSRAEVRKRHRIMHAYHLHNPIAYFPYIEQQEMQARLYNGTPVEIPMFQQAFVDIGTGMFDADVAFLDYRLDVSPVTDNRPFFYDFKPGLPPTLSLMAVVFGGILLYSLIRIIRSESRDQIPGSSIWKGRIFVAFTLLGIGFMIAEIALFQKFVLYFRHPTLALTVLLSVILLATGIGSWLSHLWKAQSILQRVQRIGLVIGAALLVFQIVSGFIYELPNGLIQPVLIVSLFLMGLVMGIPFPMLLRYLHERARQDLVPYAWGINGVASVTGSVISVILAKWFGWSMVLGIAGVIYLVFTGIVFRLQAVAVTQSSRKSEEKVSFADQKQISPGVEPGSF